MATFQERQIERTNELLWRILGPEGENFLDVSPDKTFELIQNLNDECYLFLHKALSFYCPRIIAAKKLEDGESIFKETAHMIQMVGLVTIIDSLIYKDKFALNEPTKLKKWWSIVYDNFEPNVVGQFKNYFEKNLEISDLSAFHNKFVFRRGIKLLIKNFKDLAEFLYEVQSLDMQRAAFWSIETEGETFHVTHPDGDLGPTVEPREIRRLLWKSVMNDLNMRNVLVANVEVKEDRVFVESAGEPN